MVIQCNMITKKKKQNRYWSMNVEEPGSGDGMPGSGEFLCALAHNVGQGRREEQWRKEEGTVSADGGAGKERGGAPLQRSPCGGNLQEGDDAGRRADGWGGGREEAPVLWREKASQI